MAGDFNIRDREWNSFYSHYLTHNDSLMEVADSFELKLSSPVHQVPTHYTDNSNDSNSIINFLFPCVTNFIQLVSPQPVDRFSQTKLR